MELTDCHVGVNVMLLIKYNISNNLMHNTDPLLKFKGPISIYYFYLFLLNVSPR